MDNHQQSSEIEKVKALFTYEMTEVLLNFKDEVTGSETPAHSAVENAQTPQISFSAVAVNTEENEIHLVGADPVRINNCAAANLEPSVSVMDIHAHSFSGFQSVKRLENNGAIEITDVFSVIPDIAFSKTDQVEIRQTNVRMDSAVTFLTSKKSVLKGSSDAIKQDFIAAVSLGKFEKEQPKRFGNVLVHNNAKNIKSTPIGKPLKLGELPSFTIVPTPSGHTDLGNMLSVRKLPSVELSGNSVTAAIPAAVSFKSVRKELTEEKHLAISEEVKRELGKHIRLTYSNDCKFISLDQGGFDAIRQADRDLQHCKSASDNITKPTMHVDVESDCFKNKVNMSAGIASPTIKTELRYSQMPLKPDLKEQYQSILEIVKGEL